MAWQVAGARRPGGTACLMNLDTETGTAQILAPFGAADLPFSAA
jgi:hypothetical protein